jgi:hypothetical protein
VHKLKRGRAALAAGIVAAILLAAAAYRLTGELAFAPRFTSPDGGEVVRVYFTARRWGYRGLAERALAPEVRDRLHAPNAGRPLIDDTFLASYLAVSAPKGIPLYGEYDQELQFVVTYRARWRQVTGAPPGPRGWFVYAGRDAGGLWQILGQGTGP